jgi:SAM-dependent methyltransferase
MDAALELFAREYASHRASEERDYSAEALFQLPYLQSGPHASQWRIRARTFDAFLSHVLNPAAARLRRPLDVADLGAGNGWLSYRVAGAGHHPIAVDIRDDAVDGLGAAEPFLSLAPRMRCIVAPFEELPLPTGSIDIALFNASLHYATRLDCALSEAMRVTRRGGQIAILDSPFYSRAADGEAMVAEKRQRFGDRAAILMALPFVEFLTRQRLAQTAPDLIWTRHRVRYPLGYELRPIVAAVTRRRRPSRFDLWVAERP